MSVYIIYSGFEWQRECINAWNKFFEHFFGFIEMIGIVAETFVEFCQSIL